MEYSSKYNYWDKWAGLWQRLASPLRPGHEDIEIFSKQVAQAGNAKLLLGVTPELAGISPRHVAIDNNYAMIASQWRDRWPDSRVVQGDWLHMPFASSEFELVLADGSPVLIAYPSQHALLYEELYRVLKPGGRFVVRVFVNKEETETCAHVCAQALAGQIGSFHAFKWRLGMALAALSPIRRVNIDEVYSTFVRLMPERKEVAKITGWSLRDIETIDVYRGSAAYYSYPTLVQERNIYSQWFREVDIHYGSYELAERCPILVLERKP